MIATALTVNRRVLAYYTIYIAVPQAIDNNAGKGGLDVGHLLRNPVELDILLITVYLCTYSPRFRFY